MALTPTIAQQRERWNAVPGHPAIRLRSQWGAQRSYTDDNPVTHPATRVFVHISVTNPANYNGNDAHAQAIERIGISRFPNTGISYNFGIMPNGALYEFQPVGRRGAHTVNDDKRRTCTKYGYQCPGYQSGLTATDSSGWNLNYNARSFVFCAIESTPVTAAVVEIFALAIYTAYKAGFITKDAAQNIHGHRCVSSKGCPGAKMWAVMKTIQSKINQLIAGGVQEDDVSVADVRQGVMEILNEAYEASTLPVDQRTKTGMAARKYIRTILLGIDNHVQNAVLNTDGIVKAPPSAATAAENPFWSLASHVTSTTEAARYTVPRRLDQLEAKIDAALALAAGVELDQVLQRIDQVATTATLERAALADRLDLVDDTVVAAVREELRDISGVDEDEVAARVLARFGALFPNEPA
jgi:hypothetical protein